MLNVSIKIRKEYQKYNFDDGNSMEVQGVRICLAPKIEKFIILENLTNGNKSNLELCEYCNPNFAQWYHNNSVGAELILQEISPENSKKINIKEIYSKSENLL